MIQLTRCIVFLLLHPFIFGLDQQHADNTRALIYLMKYGYVDSSEWSSSLVTEEALKEFVSKAVQDSSFRRSQSNRKVGCGHQRIHDKTKMRCTRYHWTWSHSSKEKAICFARK